MPDFDVDFCMDRRDEVIDHVAEMYGREAVSQIITFGTMAAKAAIRDVGRVLGHSYSFCDRISKLVPPDPGMTLAKAFEAEPKLPELYEQDEEVKALIDMARRLEGVTRNAGKHAGGVVIAPTKITDFALSIAMARETTRSPSSIRTMWNTPAWSSSTSWGCAP